MKLNNRQFLATVMIVAFVISSFVLPSETAAKVTAFAITRVGATMGINHVGQIDLTPASTKGVSIAGGAPIKKVLSGTASVDFTALAAGTCENFNITVTGAADGDPVALGIPAAAWATTEYATIEGFVSAANTVTLKRCNLTNSTTALSNPAAVTVRATVFQF
ncbi:MAG TPA: hypothetical protein VJU84_08610 [Pyrinomonadaceae bacterium]|nr:hypothetical protein [Pyrinomonadaceae bacterium]